MNKHVLAWSLALAAVQAGAAPRDAAAVQRAAERFVGALVWQQSGVLEADFSCAGRQQQAILGTTIGEVVVAIFTDGLERMPAVLRFDGFGRNVGQAKIRLDDNSVSADDIAVLSGAAPTGYRPSAACHGVRLSDDTSNAAHIYWDHANQRFETWTQ